MPITTIQSNPHRKVPCPLPCSASNSLHQFHTIPCTIYSPWPKINIQSNPYPSPTDLPSHYISRVAAVTIPNRRRTKTSHSPTPSTSVVASLPRPPSRLASTTWLLNCKEEEHGFKSQRNKKKKKQTARAQQICPRRCYFLSATIKAKPRSAGVT
ncbi:hypothetical protein M0R45_002367 [Rubus argutus]|uniref:Uncharacterized protein n=1 Tax=Rubus argutus TaxID=59490 RepID=A0AAW1VD41_RUBAR